MKALKSLMKSHYAMMAVCCLAMVAAYFAFSADRGESSLLSSLAPIIACVAVHFIMMKMMGKSCHQETVEHDQNGSLVKSEHSEL